ncbi:MAG: hypothetical protein R3C24_16385 [Cyanobacteriota/Melainabacteria group bacterium]
MTRTNAIVGSPLYMSPSKSKDLVPMNAPIFILSAVSCMIVSAAARLVAPPLWIP